MPAIPPTLEAGVLRKGAEALRLSTGRVALLLNTQPRGGRAACVRCGECVGFQHPESVRAATVLRERALRSMEASGARRTWTVTVATGLSAALHQAGPARMGTDPATSITDPFGRVHGHPQPLGDRRVSACHQQRCEPVLTIYALAYRCAEELALGRA